MNTHTIIRHIDEQGRIVIPKEIREILGLDDGTPMELNVVNQNLILTKYSSTNDLPNAIDTINAWLKDKENEPQIMSSLEKSILTALLQRIVDYT